MFRFIIFYIIGILATCLHIKLAAHVSNTTTSTPFITISSKLSPFIGLLYLYPLLLISQTSPAVIRYWVFLGLLTVVTLTDILTGMIYNKVLILFAIPLFFIAPQWGSVLFIALFLYTTYFIGILFFKKETLGGGDLKFYMVIALVLNTRAILLSVTIASFFALIYILITKKNGPIPFGPFISIGALLAYFFT